MNDYTDPDEIPAWFWDIIERAQKDKKKLEAILMEFDLEELKRFNRTFLNAATYLTDDPFLDHMTGSEDGVKDITAWVVSQGKDYFMEIWKHPERIPYCNLPDDSNLANVVYEVYMKKYDEIPEEI